jgi:fucose permease
MSPETQAGSAADGRLRVVVPLYGGFFFLGIATVMLGVLLPGIAGQHHLSDSQSGILLTTQFTASACGALFVRRRFAHTLVRGYLLMAAGAAVLAEASPMEGLAAIGLFSVGLGMAMTSSSLLVGRMFCRSRGSAMSMLNFSWSIGATLCPLILARLGGRFSLRELCVWLAVLSAGLGLALFPAVSVSDSPGTPAAAGAAAERSWIPILLFSALAFLYVGTESTLGGWMTTYAARTLHWTLAGNNVAAACFWAAILVGRGITPLILKFADEMCVHRCAIAGAVAGIVLLLEAHGPLTLLTGASCTGLMLGPIFPLTISLFIDRAGDSSNVGWVFAIAGFGAAALPWAAGAISSAAHSLRIGLLVTLVAAAGMLLLALQLSTSRRGQIAAATIEV